MAITPATVTITNLHDLVGVDFDPRRTKIYVTNNVDGESIFDTDTGELWQGGGTVSITGSTATITVPTPGDSNPASWQTSIHLDYPDAGTRTRKVRTFGPFTITEDADLADLVEEQEVPPEYLTAVTEQLQALVDQAELITGLTGEDEAVAALVADPDSETSGALSASFAQYLAEHGARAVPWIEGIPAWIFGHSYYFEGGDANANQQAPHRVQRRTLHQVAINRAAAGARLDEILTQIKTNHAVNTMGIVHLCGLINNSNNNVNGATTREEMRSVFAYLTARAKLAKTDDGFAYGSGWSAGVTSTAGSHFDFAWTGDAAYVAVEFTTGSATSVTVTDVGEDTPSQTLNTGGWGYAFTGMIRLAGYGDGDHTVRVTLVSGSGLTVTGALIPSPTPPTIAWLREGPLPSYTSDQNTLLTTTYRTAIEPILTDFPTVVKVQYDDTYDADLYMGVDGVHINARGHEYAASLIVAALAQLDWREGQNNFNSSTEDPSTTVQPTYTSPTPDFDGGDGGGGDGVTYTNVVRWSDGTWLYVDALPSDPSSFPDTIVVGDHVEVISGSGWTPSVTFDVSDVGVFGVGPGGANRRLIGFGGAGGLPAAGTTGGTVEVTPA